MQIIEKTDGFLISLCDNYSHVNDKIESKLTHIKFNFPCGDYTRDEFYRLIEQKTTLLRMYTFDSIFNYLFGFANSKSENVFFTLFKSYNFKKGKHHTNSYFRIYLNLNQLLLNCEIDEYDIISCVSVPADAKFRIMELDKNKLALDVDTIIVNDLNIYIRDLINHPSIRKNFINSDNLYINPSLLRFVENPSQNLCELAVARLGNTLEYVPGEFKSIDLCLSAFNGYVCWKIIRNIPDEYFTESFCLAAIEKMKPSETQSFLENLNINRQTYNICRAAVLKCRVSIHKVKDKQIQERLLTENVKNCASLRDYIGYC